MAFKKWDPVWWKPDGDLAKIKIKPCNGGQARDLSSPLFPVREGRIGAWVISTNHQERTAIIEFIDLARANYQKVVPFHELWRRAIPCQ